MDSNIANDRRSEPAQAGSLDAVVGRILRLGYYPVSGECVGEGAQIVNGEWYMPRWGCDTLQHILDEWGDEPIAPNRQL